MQSYADNNMLEHQQDVEITAFGGSHPLLGAAAQRSSAVVSEADRIGFRSGVFSRIILELAGVETSDSSLS